MGDSSLQEEPTYLLFPPKPLYMYMWKLQPTSPSSIKTTSQEMASLGHPSSSERETLGRSLPQALEIDLGLLGQKIPGIRNMVYK